MTWLFLVGQTVALMVRGPKDADEAGILISMLLSALVVWWFAGGALQARTLRLVIVWVVLSAATALGFVGLVVDSAQGSEGDLLSVAFAAAQLIALGVFGTSDYFKDLRAGSTVAPAALAPLLLIAVATGLLGGLTASPVAEATTMQLWIGV